MFLNFEAKKGKEGGLSNFEHLLRSADTVHFLSLLNVRIRDSVDSAGRV